MTDNKHIRQRRVEIYLINDDTVTFQHVIETLSSTLPECSIIRAEQIAVITHRTGMCHIYTGKSKVVKAIQSILIKHGLKIMTLVT